MTKYQLIIQCDNEDDLRSAVDTLANRSDAPVPTAAVPVTPVPEKTDTPPTVAADPDDMAVDSDGMPYDPAVHASSRAVNKDGTWKAAKGKADAAKTARAAFKAGGGNVEAPLVEADPDPMPEPEETKAALPGVGAIPPQEPVTFEQFFAKATEVLNAGKTDADSLVKFYGEITGCATTEEAVDVLQMSESVRANGVAWLDAMLNG